MPLILSLETSTHVCSVALHENEELLAYAEVREPQSHAARLAPLVEEVCRQATLAVSNIQAVAVSAGPGSYTGLRIGTSTAKGLCYALGIPLIAVGTLELLAFQGSTVNPSGGLLCPMIDARRMEVYCLIADSNLRVVEPASARVIEADSFAELLAGGSVLFFGDGAKKCQSVITHPNASFLDDIHPLASALGIMASGKFKAGQVENLVSFKPFYLKEFFTKKPMTGGL